MAFRSICSSLSMRLMSRCLSRVARGAELQARHGAGALGDLRQHALIGPDLRFDGAAAGFEDADDLELAAFEP